MIRNNHERRPVEHTGSFDRIDQTPYATIQKRDRIVAREASRRIAVVCTVQGQEVKQQKIRLVFFDQISACSCPDLIAPDDRWVTVVADVLGFQDSSAYHLLDQSVGGLRLFGEGPRNPRSIVNI